MELSILRAFHQDERGAEAVEWIAVGASLFITFAAMSLVYDRGGADAGAAVMHSVERTIGYWNGNGSGSGSGTGGGTSQGFTTAGGTTTRGTTTRGTTTGGTTAGSATASQSQSSSASARSNGPATNGTAANGTAVQIQTSQNQLSGQLTNARHLSAAQRANLIQQIAQLSPQELADLGVTTAELEALLAEDPEAATVTDLAASGSVEGNATAGHFVAASTSQTVASSAMAQPSSPPSDSDQTESALGQLLTSAKNNVIPIVDSIMERLRR